MYNFSTPFLRVYIFSILDYNLKTIMHCKCTLSVFAHFFHFQFCNLQHDFLPCWSHFCSILLIRIGANQIFEQLNRFERDNWSSQGKWKMVPKKKKTELYEVDKALPLTTYINMQRIKWYGYIWCTGGEQQ